MVSALTSTDLNEQLTAVFPSYALQ
jgi:hypothetical protein